MKKQLLVASALTIPTLGFAGSAFAANNNNDSFGTQFAEKLATKFNLNKDEVTTFIKQDREAMKAEMEAKVGEALKSAGFSDDQISALKTKKQEQRDAMEAWRTANPDATREEMKAHHSAEKTEFETWAKEQGIDLDKVRSTLKDSNLGRSMHGARRHMGEGEAVQAK